MIRIFTGSGPEFGTGHLERMRILASLLSPRHAVELTEISSDPGQIDAKDARLVLLDARDVDSRLLSCKRLIALDNQNAARSSTIGVIFHDTIPHPSIPIAETLENCLIDPALRCEGAGKKNVLVYAGSSTAAWPFARELQDLGYSITQIGGEPVEGAAHFARRTRAEFRADLCRAELVITYFGMTALEALYLRKGLLLYSIQSIVHDSLSQYLSTYGVPFVGSRMRLEDVWRDSVRIRPSGRGFENLVSLIERNL